MRRQKEYDKLELKDDFMFGFVIRRDPLKVGRFLMTCTYGYKD